MSTHDARLEVWQGEIPAVFDLAPEEVASLERPIPFHMCLPRQSLLPFVTQSIRQHFLPFAPPLVGDSELWFEHDGVPLLLSFLTPSHDEQQQVCGAADEQGGEADLLAQHRDRRQQQRST